MLSEDPNEYGNKSINLHITSYTVNPCSKDTVNCPVYGGVLILEVFICTHVNEKDVKRGRAVVSC